MHARARTTGQRGQTAVLADVLGRLPGTPPPGGYRWGWSLSSGWARRRNLLLDRLQQKLFCVGPCQTAVSMQDRLLLSPESVFTEKLLRLKTWQFYAG